MSRLCNPQDVRKKLALTEDEAPDETIYSYIDDAQKDVVKDISIRVTDESLEGNINGSNTTFTTTAGTFIADRNFDNTVTTTDISIYTWIDSDDPSTKVAATVSTIYANYGKVVLSVAPAATVEKVTADYRYYSAPVDTEVVTEACAYLAAYYYANSEISLMPKQWMHGAYRFMKTNEYKDLLVEYWKKIDRLTGSASERGENDAAELIRSDI